MLRHNWPLSYMKRPAAPGGGGGGGTIEYVGGRTHAFPGTTSTTVISLNGTLTGGLATSPAEGDLVVVSYAIHGGDLNMSIVTTGYVEVADLWASDSLDTNLGVFYKAMGATPDTDVEVMATTSAGAPGAVIIQVWRGVDATTPIDVTTTTATGVNTGAPNPPAITPVTAGAVVVVCGAGTSLNGGVTLSQSGTELSNFIAVYGDNADASNNDITAAMGSFAWTSGAFDPVALVGNAATSLSWAAATLALRPA